MRISDWSSDVCSSDLASPAGAGNLLEERGEALQVVRRVEAQVSREAALRLGQRLQNRIAAARRRRDDNVTVPYFGHHRRCLLPREAATIVCRHSHSARGKPTVDYICQEPAVHDKGTGGS